jgi:hypothetical protein
MQISCEGNYRSLLFVSCHFGGAKKTTVNYQIIIILNFDNSRPTKQRFEAQIILFSFSNKMETLGSSVTIPVGGHVQGCTPLRNAQLSWGRQGLFISLGKMSISFSLARIHISFPESFTPEFFCINIALTISFPVS